MATKKVFKTTTEYFYNDKGFVVKEIETVEEYEEEISTTVKNDIKVDIDLEKLKKEIEEKSKKPLKFEWHKTTGVPNTVTGPYFHGGKVDSTTISSDGGMTITGTLSVNEISTLVKNQINEELKKSNLSSDKAF